MEIFILPEGCVTVLPKEIFKLPEGCVTVLPKEIFKLPEGCVTVLRKEIFKLPEGRVTVLPNENIRTASRQGKCLSHCKTYKRIPSQYCTVFPNNMYLLFIWGLVPIMKGSRTTRVAMAK